MIPQDKAFACLEAAATDLKSMSYEELERLGARDDSAEGTVDRELKVCGETVYVNTTIGKLGHINRRVCVEMVLSAEDGTDWQETPCVYFERFESGRLYVARARGWDIALFKALPYVFLGIIVIGLLALVWHVFFRAP